MQLGIMNRRKGKWNDFNIKFKRLPSTIGDDQNTMTSNNRKTYLLKSRVSE